MFLVHVWIQTEHQIHLGKEFFPQNVELRETLVASVYGWCCRLCEDLGLYYQFKACLLRGLAAY